jgi:hypothetical protein
MDYYGMFYSTDKGYCTEFYDMDLLQEVSISMSTDLNL